MKALILLLFCDGKHKHAPAAKINGIIKALNDVELAEHQNVKKQGRKDYITHPPIDIHIYMEKDDCRGIPSSFLLSSYQYSYILFNVSYNSVKLEKQISIVTLIFLLSLYRLHTQNNEIPSHFWHGRSADSSALCIYYHSSR